MNTIEMLKMICPPCKEFPWEDSAFRLWLARQNPTDHKHLQALAQDDDPEVRAAVADNPGTPSIILARLEKDGDPNVRERAAARMGRAWVFGKGQP